MKISIIPIIVISILLSFNKVSAQCVCPNNLVLNPSFESGTTHWGSSGGNFSAGGGAVSCGSASGDFQITNTGSNWTSQEIYPSSYAQGTTINVSVSAGVHDNSFYQAVWVNYFDVNWNYLSATMVEVDKVLAAAPVGPQLYTFTATLPANVGHVQVGSSGTGNWIKTDGWCVTMGNVCSNVTSAGVIGSDETFCGTSFDPANINSISLPSGGNSNTIEYLWLSSLDGGANTTTISGANGPTYNPGTISVTTWFRRCSRRQGCSSYDGESNWIMKEVRPNLLSVHAGSDVSLNCYTGNSTTLSGTASSSNTNCSIYPNSVAHTSGTVSNSSNSLGIADNLGATLSKPTSAGVYNRLVVDLGSTIPAGSQICIRVATPFGGTSNMSIYTGANGITPATGAYPYLASQTFSNSSWQNYCFTTTSDCRYLKVTNDVGADFLVDAFWYNCGSICPLTYSWSNGNTTLVNSVAPTITTNYTFTVTDCAGCTKSDIVTVNVDKTPPNVTATGNSTLTCITTSSTLSASGANSYSWSPTSGLSNSSLANPVASPWTTTIYTVTGTAANGCTATSVVTVTVNQNSPAAPSVSSANRCGPGSVTFTGSAPVGSTLYWYDASVTTYLGTGSSYTTPSLSSTTNYTAWSQNNANGCWSSSTLVTASINTIPTIVASSNTTLTCITTSSTLSASGANSYSWSPISGLSNSSIANPIATPINTTNYIVTGTGANGCISTSAVTVTVDQVSPSAPSATGASLCGPGSVTFTGSAPGGSTLYWFDASVSTYLGTGSSYTTPSLSSTTNYTAWSQNNTNGCWSSSTLVTATINTIPTIIASSNSTLTCITTSTTLSASGANSYLWSPATGLNAANISNPVASPNVTTTYVVTGIASNGCGNASFVTVTVDQTAPAAPSVASASRCGSGSVTFTGSAPVGSTLYWYDASVTTYLGTGSSYTTPSLSSTTNYTAWSQNNANGCWSSSTLVTATILAIPNITATSSATITCSTLSSNLNSYGAASYSWLPATGLNATNISNPIANPSVTTVYTVTGTSTDGCISTSEVTVFVNTSAPAAPMAFGASLCGSGSVTLSASIASGTTVSWYDAAGTTYLGAGATYVTPSLSSTTNYTAWAQDIINGCWSSPTNVIATIFAIPSNVVNVSASITCSNLFGYLYTNDNVGLSQNNSYPNAILQTSGAACGSNYLQQNSMVPYNLSGNSKPNSIVPGNTYTMRFKFRKSGTGGAYARIYGYDNAWTPMSTTSLNLPNSSVWVDTSFTYLAPTSAINSYIGFVNTDPSTLDIDCIEFTLLGGSGISIYDNGSFENTIGHSWTGPNGYTGYGNTIYVTEGGTYNVTLTDATTGCSSMGSGTIGQDITKPIITATSGATITCNTLTSNLNATGAVSYSWSPAAGLSAVDISNPVATPISTTIYTITGTSTNGCTSTTEVTVIVDKVAPAAPSAFGASLCGPGSVTLSGSIASGTTVSWYDAAGTIYLGVGATYVTPNLSSTTNYTAWAQDIVNGCWSSPTLVTATIFAIPTITATSSATITCSALSSILNASGAASYSWAPATGLNATNISNPIANPTTTTVYTVIGTSADGCVSTSEVTVSVNTTVPSAPSATGASLCGPGSVTFTGSAPAGSNLYWFDAAVTTYLGTGSSYTTPSILSTTNYTAWAQDIINGCWSSPTLVTATIFAIPTITATSSATITCSTLNSNLNASGATSYSWSPATGLNVTNLSNPIANPSVTTVYTVTGTSTDGCISTSEVTVFVNTSAPAAPMAFGASLCGPGSVTLSASIASGTTVSWYDAAGTTYLGAGSTYVTPSLSSTTNYTAWAQDIVNGCWSSPTLVTATIFAIPNITATSTTTITCIALSSNLNASGALSYSWSPAASLSASNISNPVASPTSTTIYTVTGTDANGCTASSTVVVFKNGVAPAAPVAIGASLCGPGSVTLTATSVSGTTIYWYDAAGTTYLGTGTSFITPNLSSTTNYTAFAQYSINGCSSVPTVVNVTINTIPNITAASNATITCLTPNAFLSASGAVSYVWSPAAGLSNAFIANPIANPIANTTYTVVGTDANGCSSLSVVTITMDNTVPNVGIVGGLIVCDGSFTTLTGTGANTYLWSINGITTSSIIVGAGTYTVTGTSMNGCSSTSSVVVSNVQGSIGNYVWTDVNGNGLQDDGSGNGINGQTVELWNATTNSLFGSTITANDGLGNPGYYNFIICNSGDYFVKFPVNIGSNILTNQTTAVATDGNSDANPTNGNSPVFTINVNGGGTSKDNNTIDAGYYGLASIGNYAWYDWNKNGIQDKLLDGITNELPIKNVKVELFTTTGTLVGTQYTDVNGYYLFSNLNPGNYYIVSKGDTVITYMVLTTANVGSNDSMDSDVNTSTFQSNNFSVNSGALDETHDIGSYRAPKSLLDPCVCLDNSTNSINGQFSEIINIEATPGGIWKIIAQTGMYLTSSPMPPLAPISVPIGTTINNIGFGEWSYQFKHIDSIGYTVSLSDGIDTLTITNNCLYPNVNLITANFDSILCVQDAPFTLMSNPNLPGNVTYVVSNSGNLSDTVTVINPALLGPGTYHLDAIFTPLDTMLCIDKFGKDFEISIIACGFASLGNFVWSDYNNNGVQNQGEPGVSGLTVTLFNSLNKQVAVTTTDAYGEYLFDALIPGFYSVSVTLPVNYNFTTSAGTSEANATNSDVNPISGKTTTIELIDGENQRNIDAGIIFKAVNLLSTVGDRVWFDNNSNGTQDAGEPGVSNVLVELLDNSGATIAATITDVNGNYLFTNVLPGDYSIDFVKPIGTVFTTSAGNIKVSTNSDANVITGSTGTFTVNNGDHIRYIDAGIMQQPSIKSSLGDKVWNDLDADGIQDPQEIGISNVVVNLFSSNGTLLLATTLTDAFGNYSFDNLDSGTYFVQFVKPANFDFTAQNAPGSSNSSNSDANNVTGTTVAISLKQGERNPNIDAGLVSLISSNGLVLGNKVWYDKNRDGIQNIDEQGVVGVTVELYQNGLDGIEGTTDDILVQKMITNRNGEYLFTNLNASSSLADNYSVLFKNIPNEYSFTESLQGTNTSVDSDPSAVTGRTSSINLIASDLTIDAGIVQGVPAGTGSLGDKVFIDLNNNGIQETEELGQAGVVVKLYFDANNNGVIDGTETTPINETTTNALGEYIFTGLNRGDYQVGFSNLPLGFVLSSKDAGTDDSKDSDGNPLNTSVQGNPADLGTSFSELIKLPQGEDNLTIDLGIVPPANTNTLGDYVWFDQNNDGLQTANESGIPGVMVTLYNPAGMSIGSTVTDDNGKYQFVGLLDGIYNVGFSNLPTGFDFTIPSTTNTIDGSDANPLTGKTISVTLNASNNNDVSLDAGLIANRAGLGNYVWIDANRDGIQDPTEQSVSGATVTLYRPGFGLDGVSGNSDDAQAVAASITDASGKYYFGNLEVGSYQVGFTTIPTGYAFTKQNAAGDNQDNTNSDASIVSGLTSIIVLDTKEYDLTIDAGIVLKANATVGDYVWFDNNKNGIQESTEQPVAGVLATLYNANNIAIGTSITDGTGKYLISNVPEGTGYYVKFNANISGFGTNGKPTWTTPNVGNNATGTGSNVESNLDSDISNIAGITYGNTGTFTVNFGDNIRNVDGGVFTPITLSGNVWHDLNANTDGFVNNSGINAAAIPVGLRAYLVNPITNLILKATVVSSATGIFNFGEISPSTNYYIILSKTAATVGSTVPLPSLPTGWENTGEKLGITSGNDGVVNGRLNIPGTTVSVINANFGIRLNNGEAVIP
jgi:protocatechuate 3,4-dioxygenase beta subunit